MDFHKISLGIVCFFISALIMPLLMKFSKTYKIYDSTNERKIHTGNISRLGGVAIFISFFPVAVYILSGFKNEFNIYLFICGMLMAFMSGFIDDLKRIRARYKLFSQIIAASFVVASGLMVQDLRIYTVLHIEFGYFSYFITIFWIVAFMNAVNLIDGMDGLSTGIALIANFFVIIISVIMQNDLVFYLALTLECSIFGFYIFNFPPAKIFLGDGGAYFIGFMYSILPLMGVKKAAALTVFLVPMILMLIPLADIASVMYKRYKSGINIFHPDNNHLHHRLLGLGFSNKGILVIIYGYTFILGIFSIILVFVKPELTMIIFIGIILMLGISVFILRKAEQEIEYLQKESNVIENKP